MNSPNDSKRKSSVESTMIPNLNSPLNSLNIESKLGDKDFKNSLSVVKKGDNEKNSKDILQSSEALRSPKLVRKANQAIRDDNNTEIDSTSKKLLGSPEQMEVKSSTSMETEKIPETWAQPTSINKKGQNEEVTSYDVQIADSPDKKEDKKSKGFFLFKMPNVFSKKPKSGETEIEEVINIEPAQKSETDDNNVKLLMYKRMSSYDSNSILQKNENKNAEQIYETRGIQEKEKSNTTLTNINDKVAKIIEKNKLKQPKERKTQYLPEANIEPVLITATPIMTRCVLVIDGAKIEIEEEIIDGPESDASKKRRITRKTLTKDGDEMVEEIVDPVEIEKILRHTMTDETSRNADSERVTVTKTRSTVKRRIIIDGKESTVEEEFDEPEETTETASFVTRTVKDGVEIVEQVGNPNETIVFPETSSEVTTNYNTTTITKTRKVTKRTVVMVDGKEKVTEELVDEPDSVINLTESFGKIIGDEAEHVIVVGNRNELRTLNDTITVTKTRRIIRRVVIVDGKETVVEQELDGPSIEEIVETSNNTADIEKPVEESFELVPTLSSEENSQSSNKVSNSNDKLDSKQSFKQIDDSPSFLSKLRKGLKMSTSKTSRKSKDKINADVNETEGKTTSDLNAFLEKEREDAVFYESPETNEPLSSNIDDETIVTGDEANKPSNFKQGSFDTKSDIILSKSWRVIKRVFFVDGKEITIEEILDQPEMGESTKKITRKTVKEDGTEKIKEILDPIEIEKLLQYSTINEKVHNDSNKCEMITNTHKIIRRKIGVDGKESIVEETIDEHKPKELINTEPHLISLSEGSSNETTTDHTTVTITKKRKIIRRTTVIDGKETVLEEVIDEPVTDELTTLGSKHNEQLIEISEKPYVLHDVPIEETRSDIAHTTKMITKVHKITRKIKTVDGEETVEEETLDEPENVTNLTEDKNKNEMKDTPIEQKVNVDVPISISKIKRSKDNKVINIEKPIQEMKVSDKEISDLKTKQLKTQKVQSLISDKTTSIPKVKENISELELPLIGMSDIKPSSIDIKLPSAKINKTKPDKVVDIRTPNIDIINKPEVEPTINKVKNEKMPKELLTEDVIVEKSSIGPVSSPNVDKAEIKSKDNIIESKSTATDGLDENVSITFADDYKSVVDMDANYKKEISQSPNQNVNSPSFLSKLRRGLKIPKTNKKPKDKNQTQVNEMRGKIKSDVNEFLEKEREHTNLYRLSVENQPPMSIKLDGHNKNNSERDIFGEITLGSIQTNLPEISKSKNNDTATVTVLKSRRVIRRVVLIDGIEYEIEEIINEPETDQSIKKVTKRTFKDSNEVVEEVTDPNEIKKILLHSNSKEIKRNDSEHVTITKTQRIKRRIIIVDGKESIVEEEVDEPDTTEKQSPLKDNTQITIMVDNPDDDLKRITFPESSSGITTDYNTITINQYRNTKTRSKIKDSKETAVEEVVDEPIISACTINNPLNKKKKKKTRVP